MKGIIIQGIPRCARIATSHFVQKGTVEEKGRRKKEGRNDEVKYEVKEHDRVVYADRLVWPKKKPKEKAPNDVVKKPGRLERAPSKRAAKKAKFVYTKEGHNE